MQKLVNIESTATIMPCLFCGKRKVLKVVTICACKDRNYKDVSFLACQDCFKQIGEEINIQKVEE